MTEQTNEQNVEVGITLQDLRMMVAVIDLGAKRGAYEGTELSLVGDLRGRLADFVNANVPEEEQEEAKEEGDAE